MITRRGFFKAFGGAILGTAIALKLPETIVPRLEVSREKAVIILNAVMRQWYKDAFGVCPNFEFKLKNV